MKISNATIVILAIAVYVAVSQFFPDDNIQEKTAQNIKNQQIIFNEVSKDMVKQNLKDPDSAKFDNVYFNKDATCGIVNSKNSFGGYTGSIRFVRKDSAVFIQTQFKDFSKIWNKFCI